MRAETHYVDLLEARATEARERERELDEDDPPLASREDIRSARAALVPPPTTTRNTPPPAPRPAAIEPPTFVDPTLHAGRDLAQSLTTLSACADLLNGSPSELSRTVVGHLIRAEAWRASALVQATRVVRQELAVARTAVAVQQILGQVIEGFASERSIRSVAIETQSDLPHGAFVAGDERLLVGAITSAVLATLPLFEHVQNPRVIVSATLDGHDVVFAVSQDVTTPAPMWQARAFDRHWTDRPGGVPSLVAMLAIEEAARAHGGSASAAASGRGTRIAIVVPSGV